MKRAHDPRILIADDEIGHMGPILHMFGDFQCQIDLAFDGRMAIESFYKTQHHLVVLDWNMPFMGGHEALLHMDNIAKKSTPFLIYSGTDQYELDIPKTKKFQFLGHIQKGGNYPQLIRQLNSVIEEILLKGAA